MFGKVMVPLELPQAMQVPELSIQKDMVGSYALIVNSEDKVESRYLELGPRSGDQRVIRSGLEPGDRIIVQGLQRARPGIVVKPVSGTSTPSVEPQQDS